MRKFKSFPFLFFTNSLIRKLIFVLFISAIFNGGFFVYSVFAEEIIEEEIVQKETIEEEITEEKNFTLIDSDITEDTTWGKEGSPYFVDRSIFLYEGVTLFIEPGVVVKFNPYKKPLFIIKGKIIAEGTVDEPIQFTSNFDDVGASTDDDYEYCDYVDFDEWGEPIGEEVCEEIDWFVPKIGDWKGLSFYNSIGSSFKNVFFRYMGNEIYLENSNLNFIDLNISDSDSGVVTKESNININGGEFNGLRDAFVVYDDSSLDVENISIKNSKNGFTAYVSNNYKVKNPGLISFDNSILKIRNLDLVCEEAGITIFNNYSLDIKDSEIKCSEDGIVLFNEVSALIDRVKISGSTYAGITAFNNTNPDSLKLINSEITENDDGLVIFNTNNFSANRNSIHNNSPKGKGVMAFNVPQGLDFTNNWWGDVTGPNHNTNIAGLGNSVSDNVLFTPWLQYDPLIENGISNVMLIPGFQASRIYKMTGDSNLGTKFENKLWEPGILGSVSGMYMDEKGESIDKDIYTRDIINEASVFGLNTLNFYKSFSLKMDEIVETGEISEWKPIAYDWRLSPEDVVKSGIEKNNGDIYYNKQLSKGETPYIINQLQKLSETSKTGKVTIVTHSNGGLVAKALISRLVEMKKNGESDLIDRIDNLIIVAAPQLGTPKATAGILHGYDQGMFFNILLSRKNARDFGQTLPGAYGLLTSESFTKNINNELIHFDKSLDRVNNWRNKYGDSIDSYEEFENFLLDDESLRIKPSHDDLVNPTILNKNILSKVNSLHQNIDNLEIPDSISVHQIAGWGLPTIFDFSYQSKNECSSFIKLLCLKKHAVLSSDVGFTSAGDGTVVGKSAFFGKGKEYYLNLKEYNKDKQKENIFFSGNDHVNIFEVPHLSDLIFNILKLDTNLPEYVTHSVPSPAVYTVLKMRSPVSMDIYDEKGNHTGIDEEGIPNSIYLEFGDEKYIVVPKEGIYNVKLVGLSDGIFTFEQEQIIGDSIGESVVFKDIPTTANLKGDVNIIDGALIESISIDEEGDGTFIDIKPTDVYIEEIPKIEEIKKRNNSSGSYPSLLPFKFLLPEAEIKREEKVTDNNIVMDNYIEKTNKIAQISDENETETISPNSQVLGASASMVDDLKQFGFTKQLIIGGCLLLILLSLKFIFKVL